MIKFPSFLSQVFRFSLFCCSTLPWSKDLLTSYSCSLIINMIRFIYFLFSSRISSSLCSLCSVNPCLRAILWFPVLFGFCVLCECIRHVWWGSAVSAFCGVFPRYPLCILVCVLIIALTHVHIPQIELLIFKQVIVKGQLPISELTNSDFKLRS